MNIKNCPYCQNILFDSFITTLYHYDKYCAFCYKFGCSYKNNEITVLNFKIGKYVVRIDYIEKFISIIYNNQIIKINNIFIPDFSNLYTLENKIKTMIHFS